MEIKDKQKDLFDKPIKEDWEKEWIDMPEFIQEDTNAYRQIIISFKDKESVKEFAKLIKQNIGPKTKSLWIPVDDREKPSLFKYITSKENEP